MQYHHNEAVFCLQAKKPVHTGVRIGCHYLIRLCLSACVTFVDFTDCESCTRPISTNSGCMETGVYGLMRGTCSRACRLEVDAVAGLLWVSWCVSSGADSFVLIFF